MTDKTLVEQIREYALETKEIQKKGQTVGPSRISCLCLDIERAAKRIEELEAAMSYQRHKIQQWKEILEMEK